RPGAGAGDRGRREGGDAAAHLRLRARIRADHGFRGQKGEMPAMWGNIRRAVAGGVNEPRAAKAPGECTRQAMNALRMDVVDDFAVITFDLPDSKANTLGQAVLGEFEALIGQLA